MLKMLSDHLKGRKRKRAKEKKEKRGKEKGCFDPQGSTCRKKNCTTADARKFSFGFQYKFNSPELGNFKI